MPAGFQLFNSSGGVMIDSNYISHGLVKSGYLSNIGSVPGYPSSNTYGFVINNPRSPIWFIDGPGFTPWHVIPYGSSLYVYFLLTPLWTPRNCWDGTGSVSDYKFYVFDDMRSNKSGRGLEIFTPDGRVCFNSDQTPMNIAASVTGPPIWHAPSGPNRAYDKAYGIWTYDATSFLHSNTASRSYGSIGLSDSRQYAAFVPYTRGATVRNIDQAPVWYDETFTAYETFHCGGGPYFGFSWGVDWHDNPDYNPSDPNNGLLGPYPEPTTVSFVDATALPFPFEY